MDKMHTLLECSKNMVQTETTVLQQAKSAVFRQKSSGNNTNDNQQGVMSPACIVLANNYVFNPILIH